MTDQNQRSKPSRELTAERLEETRSHLQAGWTISREEATELIDKVDALSAALGRVEELAASWQERGEADIALSETLPEMASVIARAGGNDMIACARELRNALKGTAQ